MRVSGADDALTCRRVERKRITDEEVARELESIIARRLPLRGFDGSGQSRVTTLYFERESREASRDRDGATVRIRAKRYAPADRVSTPAHAIAFELKRRRGVTTRKARSWLSPDELMARLRGASPRLRPICLVSYLRRVYERDHLRVTVDRMLSCDSADESSIAMLCRGEPSTHFAIVHPGVVFELKHVAPLPAWGRLLLVEADDSFSKLEWATQALTAAGSHSSYELG